MMFWMMSRWAGLDTYTQCVSLCSTLAFSTYGPPWLRLIYWTELRTGWIMRVAGIKPYSMRLAVMHKQMSCLHSCIDQASFCHCSAIVALSSLLSLLRMNTWQHLLRCEVAARLPVHISVAPSTTLATGVSKEASPTKLVFDASCKPDVISEPSLTHATVQTPTLIKTYCKELLSLHCMHCAGHFLSFPWGLPRSCHHQAGHGLYELHEQQNALHHCSQGPGFASA